MRQPTNDLPEVPFLTVSGYDGNGGKRAVVLCPFACGIPRGFHVHGDGPGPRRAHCVTRSGEYLLRPATRREARLIQQVYDNNGETIKRPECPSCGQPSLP